MTPTNIFTSWQGVVKLADFGIAKHHNVDGPDERKQIMGKVPYMSPEQARGEITDHRTDIFALGLVFFEMLTGEQLFPTGNVEEVIELHKAKRIPDPREWNPAIPPEALPMLQKLCAYDSDERYQSADEVVKTMEKFMYGGGYGPTNEKLAVYLNGLFPEVDKQRIIPDEVVVPQ